MQHPDVNTCSSRHQRRRWRHTGVMLVSVIGFLVGRPALALDEPPRFELPEADKPRLLLPSEVKAGLAIRVQQMRERYDRRASPQDELRSFEAQAEPPAGVDLPPPPDAPGGEIDLERQQTEAP